MTEAHAEPQGNSAFNRLHRAFALRRNGEKQRIIAHRFVQTLNVRHRGIAHHLAIMRSAIAEGRRKKRPFNVPPHNGLAQDRVGITQLLEVRQSHEQPIIIVRDQCQKPAWTAACTQPIRSQSEITRRQTIPLKIHSSIAVDLRIKNSRRQPLAVRRFGRLNRSHHAILLNYPQALASLIVEANPFGFFWHGPSMPIRAMLRNARHSA